MAKISEIAPDLFRLSIYVPDYDMQFNHFLVRDEAPLMFHAGLKGMFAELREAVATLINPSTLRYVAWSHFESDEIGGLNHWLELAPEAEPVCTFVGKLVSVDDFSIRPARGMMDGDTLTTGKHRFRFHRSPHLPHGWDAGLLFEETEKILFCSDLFHQFGDGIPVTSNDLLGPSLAGMRQMQQGPLASYMPYTRKTEGMLHTLAQMQPETLAVMHGSSYSGKSSRMLTDLADALRDMFDVT